MQRIPHSSSGPLLPTPTTGVQTSAGQTTLQSMNAGAIQPLMSAQPPTHIPPPGFQRSLPPPRYQAPSVPPPGARPIQGPPGPRGPPPMGYPG